MMSSARSQHNEYIYMDNNILILTRLRQYSDYESTM